MSSNTCFCGNIYGKLGSVADSQCSYVCNGNPNQICGAAWRNSVYTMPTWATGMINHWSFTNNNLDSVTLLTATATSNGLTFVSDRNNKNTSALSFSGGYLTLASAVYFNGDFTLTVWASLDSFNSWSRVIDCANTFNPGQTSDNVFVAVSYGANGAPVLSITNYVSGGDMYTMPSTQQWTIGQWGHLAMTLSGTTATLYFNNVQVAQRTSLIVPRGNQRPSSFIGYSRYAGDGLLNGALDDLCIFSRVLSTTELTQVYNFNR